MKLNSSLLGVLIVLAASSVAKADPCEAPVQGYRPGEAFDGVVRYVGDGDGLCIGRSADPASWVEVRLVNWFAPELDQAGGFTARDELRRRTMGRRAVCVVERGFSGRTFHKDRVFARCRVEGRDVADLMQSAGVRQGGRGYRGGW